MARTEPRRVCSPNFSPWTDLQSGPNAVANRITDTELEGFILRCRKGALGATMGGRAPPGFVYAKDGDFETAKLMARGGFAFARPVQKWVECDIACVAGTPPFDYVVHRDSLVPADQIELH